MTQLVNKQQLSYHSQQLSQSVISNQILSQAQGDKPFRRRTPSELKRRSTPGTPTKVQEETVVAGGGGSSRLQGSAYKKNLNMSINYTHYDNQLFPSLSQTPKFEVLNQRSFQEQQIGIKQHRIRSSHSKRMQKLNQHSRFEQDDKQKQFSAWEKTKINQFQIRNLTPQQVIEYLEDLCKKQIKDEIKEKPSDFDSTEAIDSFLEALFIVSSEQINNFNQAQREKMHLSTGIRTEICEDFLAYLANLQQRNQTLQDAVEYFKVYIDKLQQLEEGQVVQQQEIKQLNEDKENLTCQVYELDKKCKELLIKEEQMKKKEQELNQTLRVLKKKLDQKKDECESLQFRIKHMEDLANMMEPPIVNQTLGAEVNDQSEPAEGGQDQQRRESNKIKNLESVNQKLENELKQMKEKFEKQQLQQEENVNDNSDHFIKIQELFNKVQVENKQLKSINGKLESQLESKQKLISHLEGKVTSIMLEKEETIVQLKAQILLLKNQNQVLEKKNNEGMEKSRQELEKQISKQFQEQVQGLSHDLEVNKRDKEEFLKRVEDLQAQYLEMESEFRSYKESKEEQERLKDESLKELESQLHQINRHYENIIQQLQEKIDSFENQNQVLAKNNEILDTKIGYFRDSTYNLMKQIQFIKEDINKSWTNMQNTFDVLKQSMFEANNNKDYLISVKKAAKQSQSVLDMGLQALNNVLQIINFLKVEELYSILQQNQGELEFQIISQEVNILQEKTQSQMKEFDYQKNNELDDQQLQRLIISNKPVIDLDREDTIEMRRKFISKRTSERTHIDPVEGLKIQRYLKGKALSNKMTPRISQMENNWQDQVQIERNEEYYFHQCPFELSSILLKFLAEILLLFEACAQFETLPINLSTLLDLANEKTDVFIEQEIFQKYLVETKKLLENKIIAFREEKDQKNEQIQMLEQEVRMLNQQKSYQGRNHLQAQQHQQFESEEDKMSGSGGEEDQSITPSRKQRNSVKSKQNSSFLQQQQQTSQQSRSQRKNQQVYEKASNLPPSGMEVLNLQFQEQSSLIDGRKREQRHYSMFQPNEIASPVGKKGRIGENQKKSSSQKKKRKNQNEVNELLSQLEQQKLELKEHKQKSKELSLQLATKIVILEEQVEILQLQRDKDLAELEESKKIELERAKQGIQQRENLLLQNVNELGEKQQNLEKEIQQLNEIIEEKNSFIVKLNKEKEEFNHKISLKEEEFSRYRENVQLFVNVKTTNRCTFSIAFEITQSNQSMINESMVKFYLSRCLGIDKAKFRFIASDEQEFIIDINNINTGGSNANSSQLGISQNTQEVVTVAKIILEIIDDEESKNFNNNQLFLDAQQCFQMIKQQIRDGSCVLYDLEPLYFSLNLGYFGLKGYTLLSDYHLIKKRGLILKNKEFIVSLLRHKEHPLKLKVLAINYQTGEDFQLDLEREDIMELLQGEQRDIVQTLCLQTPPEEFLNLILNNLIILTKDGVDFLVCEHKVFFNNVFHNTIATSLNKHKSEINRYETVFKAVKESQNHYRNSELRNSKILQQVSNNQVSNTKIIENIKYKEQLLIESECQTDFETSLLYEGFSIAFQGHQKLGKKSEFKIQLFESQKSNSLQIIFEEIHFKKRVQVCFIENKPVFDQIPSDYIIYTHCLKIKGNHLVLFSIEKVIDDGLFVKIHDLKDLVSEEFFLIKKSSGQYSKLTRTQGGGFIIKEDFRNLIYELTFSYSSQVTSNQILLANISYHKQMQSLKNASSGEEQPFDLEKQLLVLPQRPRNGKVGLLQLPQEIKKLELVAQLISCNRGDSEQMIQQDQQKRKVFFGDKGNLLYRNSFVVRCMFEGQMEQEQESLISFYVNKEEISVEVFLYKDSQKMSIASSVTSIDLFGVEIGQLSFNQQIEMLDLMMEKLYVLSENKQYHLKVENSAVPISQIIYNRKLSQSSDTNAIQQALEINNVAEKVKYIQSNKSEILSEGFAQKISNYFVYNNHFYEYSMYFLNKLDRDSPDAKSSPKKARGLGGVLQKRQTFDRQISNAEAYLEDNVDYDQIYIEISDKENEFYCTVLTQKLLAELLMKNKDSPKFRQAFSKGKQTLAEFIVNILKIDKEEGKISMEYNKQEKQHFITQFVQQTGGIYRKRKSMSDSSEEIETQEDILKKELVGQRLVLNQEIEFCEFTFDIKVFEFSLKESGEVLSYGIEIFNLNDAETIYTYYHPIEKVTCGGQIVKENQSYSEIESPYFIGVDIFNLIDNPLKDDSINASPQSISIESTVRKNFHSLFSKYIDNNLMIVVQEQKFPFSLNVAIIEPCSKLQWSHTITIQECSSTLSQSLGRISLIEQSVIEQFLILFLNERRQKQAQLELQVDEEDVRVEKDLKKLSELEASPTQFEIFFFEKQINSQFQVSLTKESNSFILHLSTGKFQQEDKENKKVLSSQSLSQEINQSESDLREMHRRSVNTSQKTLSYKFEIQNHAQKFFSKLICLKSKSTLGSSDLDNKFLVFFEMKYNTVQVKILTINSLKPSRIIYKFLLQCKENKQELINKQKDQLSGLNVTQLLPVPSQHSQISTFDRQDHREQINNEIEKKVKKKNFETMMEGLKNFYPSTLIELVSQTHEELLLQQTKSQECNQLQYSSENNITDKSGSKAYSQTKQQSQILKTYFDDSQEKLIIVMVSVNQVCPQYFQTHEKYASNLNQNQMKNEENKRQFQEFSLCQDIHSFKLTIYEPETKKKNEFQLELTECFLEEEILGLNRKSFSSLRRMAKILVEERIIIKRSQEGQVSQQQQQEEEGVKGLDTQQNNLYSIEINVIPNIKAKMNNQVFPQKQNTNTADSIEIDSEDLNLQSNKRMNASPQNQLIASNGGQGFISVGKIDSKQRPEEILELDEEDEEDSAKKKMAFEVNHSIIIEEEMSQEEHEDNNNYTNQSTKKKAVQNLSEMKIEEFQINEKEVRNSSQNEELRENEEDEFIQTDELEESSLNTVLVKQLPKDQVLKILESSNSVNMKEGEDQKVKFVIRKTNAFANQILEERGITLEEIRNKVGFEGDVSDESLKDELLEAIANYIAEDSLKNK